MPSPETEAFFTKLATLDADDQEELVETGEQFGSTDILRQIERFESAQGETGDIPVRHGFSAADKAELRGLGVAVSEVSGVRLGKGVDRSTATDDYRNAFSEAKGAMRSARTVLDNTQSALRVTPGPDAKAARSTIAATLAKSPKVGRSKTRLIDLLTLLGTALRDAKVAPAAADRGGPEALTAVTSALATLSTKAPPATKVRGTPAETRRLNMLEGYAVNLLRRARAAARDWASAQKNPTLGKPYELEFLYGAQPAPPAPPAPPVVPS